MYVILHLKQTFSARRLCSEWQKTQSDNCACKVLSLLCGSCAYEQIHVGGNGIGCMRYIQLVYSSS